MGRRREDLAERLWPRNLQEIQDTLSLLVGVPLLFADASGRPLAACEDLALFCRWFTRTVEFPRPCLECNRASQLESLADAGLEIARVQPLLHICPMGPVDVAVPIASAGDTIGYLVTAQIRADPETGTPEVAHPDRPQREAEECRSLLCRLPRRPVSQIERVAAGLSVVGWFAGALSASRRRSVRLAERVREQSRWLQEQTSTDAVTGLANRRHFGATLSMESLRAHRYKRDLSVAVLDIEGFRTINEEFDHDTGDAVLRSVSRYLTSTLRQTDVAGRVGGDEFGLILPETSRPEAMIALARITAQMDDLNASGELPVEVRLTVGLADRATSPDDLLAAAYRALRQTPGLPGLIR